MYKISSIYNPDEQQVLEYHKELLKKAEQAQLIHSAMEASKRSIPSISERIRQWLESHRPIRMVHAHSHSHSHSRSHSHSSSSRR